MQIVSVSSHALERFREHEPAADTEAVLLAARMAIPIASDLAHMLAGRSFRAATSREENAHRVHLNGAGIFVLCPSTSRTDASYVKTYLRLSSVVQREMVHRWFLTGISPVRDAFELGFRAAREAPDSVTVGEALEAYAADILRLAGHEGALRTGVRDALAPVVPPAPVPTEPSTPKVPPPPPEPIPAALAPTPASARARAARLAAPKALVDGIGWSAAALEQQAWFASQDGGWVSDLSRWRALSLAERGMLMATGSHVGPMGPATAIWLEPEGRAVAFVVELPGAAPLVHRLSAVPRAVRESFGLPGRVMARGPAKGAPATNVAAPMAMVPPPPTPPPPPLPPAPLVAEETTPRYVSAEGLRVSHWNARARTDARTAGLAEIATPWLDHIDAVPVEACPAVAAEFGWRPAPGGLYALRRGAGYALLLTGVAHEGRFSVARCARDRTTERSSKTERD